MNTPMQALAVRVRLHKVRTICNIYSPISQVLNCQLLEDIHSSKPVIILGDFNAYNIMWGSITTDVREREIEEFISRNNINIINDGAPTHITYYAETATDLTMCTATLEADLHWSAAASPGDSDHGPVFVTYDELSRVQQNERSKHWKIKGSTVASVWSGWCMGQLA